MRRPTIWILRGMLLALLAAVVVGAARRGRTAEGLIPVIGGDTWPPVPVKDARPA